MNHRITPLLAAMILSPFAVFAQQPTNDSAGVRAANKAFYDALSNHDATAMANLYAHEPYVAEVNPGIHDPFVGRPAIQEWLKAVARGNVKSVPTVLMTRINGDTAWVLGTEQASGTLANGKPIDQRLIFTNIFERHDGRWLMVLHNAH